MIARARPTRPARSTAAARVSRAAAIASVPMSPGTRRSVAVRSACPRKLYGGTSSPPGRRRPAIAAVDGAVSHPTASSFHGGCPSASPAPGRQRGKRAACKAKLLAPSCRRSPPRGPAGDRSHSPRRCVGPEDRPGDGANRLGDLQLPGLGQISIEKPGACHDRRAGSTRVTNGSATGSPNSHSSQASGVKIKAGPAGSGCGVFPSMTWIALAWVSFWINSTRRLAARISFRQDRLSLVSSRDARRRRQHVELGRVVKQIGVARLDLGRQMGSRGEVQRKNMLPAAVFADRKRDRLRAASP